MVSSAHCRSSTTSGGGVAAPTGASASAQRRIGLEALLGRLLLRAVGGLRPAAAGVEDLLERGQRQRLTGQLQARTLDHLGDRAGPFGGDQGGLADAGLTADEEDVAGLGEGGRDRRAVVRPADIGDRRRPGHRSWCRDAAGHVQVAGRRLRGVGRPRIRGGAAEGT